jgi:hypothetical protein
MSELIENFDLEVRVQSESLPADFPERDGLLQTLRTARTLVDEFNTVATAIRSDEHLSDSGREKALDEARRKALAAVERWQAEHVEPVDRQMAHVTDTIAKKLADAGPRPSDDLARLMAERLQAFDDVQRMSLYASADPQTRRVMERAAELLPVVAVQRDRGGVTDATWVPLLDPDAIARHREAQLRDADPAVTAHLRVLERRRGVLRGVASAARAGVRDFVR